MKSQQLYEGHATAWRCLRLCLSVTLRSKVKFSLLTVLVALSIVVFLAVAELSHASTDNLDEALTSDLGAQGSYSVTLAPELGLTRDEVLATVRRVAAGFAHTPISVAATFPSIRAECPPFNQLGELTAAVLLGPHGEPLPFRPAALPTSPPSLCLAGLVVPSTAVREATNLEKGPFGAQLVVDPLYAGVLRLSSQTPPSYTAVITTGRNGGQLGRITDALQSAFAPASARASLNVGNAVVVRRLDTGGSVRSAADGIRLVYRLIGWGVLLVGGIGMLVAELIVLRDRTWFFGLTRAMGARRWNVAWLVFADIVVVLLAGLALAIALLLVTAPSVGAFGRQAFQVHLQILRPGALPGLLLGLLVVLVLGGAYPAWRVTRLDPLDVLERS